MTARRDQFIEAISHATMIAGDEEVGEDSAQLYSGIEGELAQLLRPDEQPSLAFLSFVPIGARNQMALTALFQERLIVGWSHGFLRKKFGSLTVPYSTITGVTSTDVSPDPSLGGNPAVTIESDRPLVIAIPPQRSPLAAAVRDSLVEAAGL